MKITIHIGSTKTGSSALQMHLYQARDKLSKARIHYSELGVKSNAHHVLFASVHPGAWVMHKDVLPANEEDRVAYFKKTFSSILLEAERTNAEHVILSSEYWWTVLPPKFWRLIEEQLTGHDVRLVACVRRQDRWLEASYLQAVKGGEEKEFGEWLGNRLQNPIMGGANYLKILNHWTEILLPVETIVIPYEFSDRTTYIKNVVNKICDRALGDVVVPKEAKVVNKSPNKQGLDAMIAVNKAPELESTRGKKVAEIMSSLSRPENSKKSVVLEDHHQLDLIKKFQKINTVFARLYCEPGTGNIFDEATSLQNTVESKCA